MIICLKIPEYFFSEGFGCSWDEFRCKNYNCISNLLICDGHNHCGDRSEQNTSSCKYLHTIVDKFLFVIIAIQYKVDNRQLNIGF